MDEAELDETPLNLQTATSLHYSLLWLPFPSTLPQCPFFPAADCTP